MTAEQAYREGFCKVAEYHGIDPEALAGFAKEAAIPSYLAPKGLLNYIYRPNSALKGVNTAMKNFLEHGKSTGRSPFSTLDDVMNLRRQTIAEILTKRHLSTQAARGEFQKFYPNGIPEAQSKILDRVERITNARRQRFGNWDYDEQKRLIDNLKKDGFKFEY